MKHNDCDVVPAPSPDCFLNQSVASAVFGRKSFDDLFISMIVYVSAVDGLLIDALYLAIGLLWRNIIWIKKFNALKKFSFVAGRGLMMAGFVEYHAVYVAHRWAYKVGMPTIFGLGLSPLVQLSLAGLLSIWLGREILYGKGLLRRSARF